MYIFIHFCAHSFTFIGAIFCIERIMFLYTFMHTHTHVRAHTQNIHQYSCTCTQHHPQTCALSCCLSRTHRQPHHCQRDTVWCDVIAKGQVMCICEWRAKVRTRVCVYTYMYMYTHTHNTYKHIYTHTHAYTHVEMFREKYVLR